MASPSTMASPNGPATTSPLGVNHQEASRSSLTIAGVAVESERVTTQNSDTLQHPSSEAAMRSSCLPPLHLEPSHQRQSEDKASPTEPIQDHDDADMLNQPLPLLDKVGTSYLDQAILEGNRNDPDSSSSEDEGQPKQGNSKKPKKSEPMSEKKMRKERKLHGWHMPHHYHRFRVGNDQYQTKGKVNEDGRLRISLHDTSKSGSYVAKMLTMAVHRRDTAKSASDDVSLAAKQGQDLHAVADMGPKPRLNIVIMVIGSRGDIQPFIRIAKVLKENHGHRVRIATHPVFRDLVEKEAGLELFSIGGDPSELMAFMVKNPGMIPTLESVKAGEIGKRRAAMAAMFEGFWRACVCASEQDNGDGQNFKSLGSKPPFVADAIIANPPSFAHMHCAEALGIPLHLMFTFPYTPTQAFPHPLASIKRSNVDPGYTNFMSYPLVEMMVWQGLGDLINDFRVKTLCLDPVSTLWAPGSTYRMHIPFSYLWSPGLVPKPKDWGFETDISGFVFLDLATTFKPPKDLEDFLNAGDPPVYIGFGSIVVDDADKFTAMIFKAVEMAGVRALVSRGWGGFGNENVPDNIFMLDNIPHDWLFPRVSACVIHGGAGTTAIALKVGLPTMVVPFFGDQYFWGNMIAKAGVGPEPVPYKQLTEEKLADGIRFCLTVNAHTAARGISKDIDSEGDGAINAVNAFHKHLRLLGARTMRCSILPDRVGVWKLKATPIKLSTVAADILVGQKVVTWKQLRLLRHNEWNDLEGPRGPLSGIATSLAGTLENVVLGVGGVPYHIAKQTKGAKEIDFELIAEQPSQNQAEKGVNTSEPAASANNRIKIALPRQSTAVSQPTSNGRPKIATSRSYAGYVTSGVGRTASAIAKAPADLSLALAQGFHNAPRLYGDDTVRTPQRVTGLYSGLKAARSEFIYGVYDGWTGVVRQPVRGAQKEGLVGFFKGTGKGAFGFIFKNVSAILGPVAYTMKGVVKQIERPKQPRKGVRRSRIWQGQKEVSALDKQQQRTLETEVVEGFALMKELYDAIVQYEKRRGLVGHWDKVFIGMAPLFEDVTVARKSLQALKKGETLDHIRKETHNVGIGAEKDVKAVRRSMSFTTVNAGFAKKGTNSDHGGEPKEVEKSAPDHVDSLALRSVKTAM